MVKSRIAWLVTIAMFLGSLSAGAQAPTVVLEGGTLIDGTGSNPINNAVIVVEGNLAECIRHRIGEAFVHGNQGRRTPHK